ncbi:MAG: RNA polymerase sigma factor, partial [Gemmataceae bacterium]
MMHSTFEDLLQQLRAGNENAAAELVRRYEPEIRREVRFVLRDPLLRRSFDSQDISQSVMGSFFLRVTLGEYNLQSTSDLTRLLLSMARNKVADAARRYRAKRRDHRRATSLEQIDLKASGQTPSQIVENRDLLEMVMNRMDSEEQKLMNLREAGQEWRDIAEIMGGTAEARRKQLNRA